MKKFIRFLKKSNHYKKLLGGFGVGLLACSPWTAIYSIIMAATCLELKDWLQGNKYDWTDWLLTISGGLLATFI
nr:MAG TPA: putative periplasmic lipoprotein [Caudoviricetes sp.]